MFFPHFPPVSYQKEVKKLENGEKLYMTSNCNAQHLVAGQNIQHVIVELSESSGF